MAETKDFLVSVCDAKVLDPANNDAFIFSATTLLDSTLTASMSKAEVRGGFANKKIFEFYHTKALDVKLTNAKWDFQYLALNNSASIVNGLDAVYKFNECVVLTAGAGVTNSLPVGNLFVEKPDGTTVTITPTGSNFTVAGLTNETVIVTYKYNNTVDKLVIDAGSVPKIVKVIMQAKIYDANGLKSVFEITIDRLQLNGSWTLDLKPDAVSSTSLEGVALAYNSGSCADSYATIRVIPQTNGITGVTAIAATPSTVNLAVAGTQTLLVYGLRNGTYGNVIIPNASCTYNSSVPAKATVSASGVVTAVSAGTSLITVTYNGISDYVNVTVA